MSAKIPTTEPLEFTVGDTVKWKISLSDYPANEDSNTLSYAFVNSSNTFSATGAASGTDHLVTISAATSGALTAGTYQWQAYITNSSGERYQVRAGTVLVKPNYADGAVDSRSHVKKVLDAIESVIEGRASEDASSMSIAGRSITKMTLDELLAARDKYKIEYANEVKLEKIALGHGHKGIVRVRFKD